MFLSGCTLAAQATPAEPSAVSSSNFAPTPTPQLSPVEAANTALRGLYGSTGVASVVTGVAIEENGLVVTLAHPATTLGAAEEYWRICRALVGTLQPPAGTGTAPAVLVAAPDGKVVVHADASEATCKLG